MDTIILLVILAAVGFGVFAVVKHLPAAKLELSKLVAGVEKIVSFLESFVEKKK